MPGCQSYNPAEDVPSPAAELRAAAAKIREMATDTTRGPWDIADCELYPRWILSAGQMDREGYGAADVARSYTESDDDGLSVSDADWRWMAFAHPGLAEPLAAMFDAAADYFEPRPLTWRLLDFARAINAERTA